MAILRGRSFSPRARFAAIRAEPDRARRRTMIDALAADSRREQQAFRADVEFLGGRVLRHHWLFHACTIEIPRIRLDAVAGHPSAAVLSPNQVREPASAGGAGQIPPAPIGGSRSPDNHNIDAAHLTLGHKGQGANVAFFDTGVDLDQSGSVGNGGSLPDPDPHRAFLNGTLSRILHSEKAGPIGSAIDCNDPSADPWCFGTFQYPSARHGTGVAAIALGAMDPDTIIPPPPFPPPPLFQEGHAPGAKLLSFSISLAGGAGEVWPTTSDVVLDAVERLMSWLLANAPERVHVLNISYSLFPDPDEPTQLALDLLEREFDVLVVAAASNEGDATGQAPGFTNGLSVGNVHKWYYTTGFPAARYPHRTTSRGPLFGDRDRYYPDVCASGASVGVSRDPDLQQIVMPLLDDRHQPLPPLNACRPAIGVHNQWYNSAGTSMASPQVAGAAALYRAERPNATALETKAAVLLATVDPLQAAQTPMVLHTYIDRNATGVGYVRDDLLAIYAKRSSNPNPDNDGTSAVLTPQAPSVSIAYTGLTIGARYAVAVAWPRVFPADEEPASLPWANLDLEIQTTGGAPALIARSDSLRNTYERLVFKADYSSVTIQVTAVDFQGAAAVPVFVAYRKLTNITVTANGAPSSFESRRSIPGFVKTLAQEPACSHSVPDQSVARTLPASYRDAYGSGPFALGSADSGADFAGMPIGTSQQIVENIYAASELGSGGAPFPIRGLALRSWSPFRGCNGNLTIQEVYLYKRAHTAGTTLTGLLHRTNTPRPDLDPDTVLVALNLSIPVHNPKWNARGYETWPIIIPFATEFVVDPTKALGIWIRFASGNVCPDPTNSYGIDYVDDQQPGMPLPYAMYHPSWGSAGIDGAAAVFGLLEGVTASRNVEVDLYGFPRVSADVLFQIRQATPNSFAVIGLGVANPNALVGACRFLSSAELLITGGLATSAMGDARWAFTFPGGLLHQHIFAQAATASGLYSNGLRLTIGGIAP